MEPISLVAGIVPLYNVAIDLLDRVRDFKDFEDESQTSLLRFDASKLKLQNWAENLGIHRGKLLDPHDSRLDDPRRGALVQNILRASIKIFDKVEYRNMVNILSDVLPARKHDTESQPDSPQSDEILDILADFDIGLEKLVVLATTQRQHYVDSWLDAIKEDDQYSKVIELRLDGTCEWIFSHPAYTSWEPQDFRVGMARVLWVNGPAGFGKTVLSAAIIKHMKTSSLPLAYCFSASHAQSIQEMDGIVRTWITQLIRQDKASLGLAHQMQQVQNTRRALKDEVWTLLKNISTELGGCVLVIDGLDEFRSFDGRRRQFLSDLKQVLQGTNCCILITSRSEFDIESELRRSATGSPKLLLSDCKVSRDLVKDDIDLVSRSIVARRLPKQREILRQEIATQMAERCDGQFLWLKLQQDLLRDSKSPKALREIVQAMPQKLHTLYERSWSVINALEEPDRTRAIDILRWLTFTYRPLTVQELAEALVVNLETDATAFSEEDLPGEIDDDYIDGEIKNLCGSLVELRVYRNRSAPASNTVHFVHASVREFLVKNLPVPPLLGPLPNAILPIAAQHAYMAARCIRFLDCSGAWNSTKHQRRSFTAYAAHFWFTHLKNSNSHYHTVSWLVDDFLEPRNANFDMWREIFEPQPAPRPQKAATSFYYASLFGLIPAMESLHGNKDVNIDAIGGRYGTPLQAACAEGYAEAFDRLMLWKADVTVRSGHFGNALGAAAYYGRIHMVESLLDPRVSKIAAGLDSYQAMIVAAGRGHLEVVRLLLIQWPDVESFNSSSLAPMSLGDIAMAATPLHAAADSGNLNIVEIFLERGADPNKKDEDGETALHHAAAQGSYKIVRSLLQHGVDVNIQGYDGAALHLAASHGYLNSVKQLVEYEAVLEAASDSGQTPLHEAAREGHLEIVDFLFENGADVDAQCKLGMTPIHDAANGGWLRIVKLLVEKGGDMDISDNKGWTPLHSAILHDHSDVAEFLIQKGSRLTVNNRGWTPLHAAAYRAQLDTMAHLLRRQVDINARDQDGTTPLSITIQPNGEGDEQQQHIEAIRLLLLRGADSSSDNLGWTPLHWAARSNYPQMVALFLDQGWDIDMQNVDGSTPLSIAAENNSIDMTKLLLDRGADSSSDNSGSTPLHWAARSNYSQMVAIFLDQGWDIDMQNVDGSTPLFSAIACDSLDATKLLLDRGAEIKDENRGSWEYLSIAVRKERLEFTKILIERGCNVNTVVENDLDSYTALREAIWEGTDEVVEFLVQSGADLSAMDTYGMRCSDWMRRLRPNLTESFAAGQEWDEADSGPNFVILTRTLLKKAIRIRENKDENLWECYGLARCFLLLGMEEETRLAYQQGIFLASERQESISCCDNCPVRSNTDEPFFRCRKCPDVDLCMNCMDKYRQEDVLRVCRGHEFLKIVPSEASFRPSDTEKFNAWLDRIVEQYKDA